MNESPLLKLRFSVWLMPVCGALFALVALVMALIVPDLTFEGLALLGFVGALSLAGVLLGALMLPFTWMRLMEDRVMYRGRNGWEAPVRLEAGDRWVIAGNAVCAQRADGTLTKTPIAKWNTAKRDWRRLQSLLPAVGDR